MMKKMQLRSSPALLICASLAVAAPLAFAQDSAKAAHDQAAAQVKAAHAQAKTGHAAQAATPAVPPTGDARRAVPAVPPAPAASGEKKWSDLDRDGNGQLSVEEAAAMPSLAKIFSEADGNGDGQLTQDEYKTWLADSHAGKRTPRDGNGG